MTRLLCVWIKGENMFSLWGRMYHKYITVQELWFLHKCRQLLENPDVFSHGGIGNCWDFFETKEEAIRKAINFINDVTQKKNSNIIFKRNKLIIMK